MSEPTKSLHPIPEEWRDPKRYGFILSLFWFGFGYWLRQLFVAPAPMPERCVMGGPVHPWVHCPRQAVDGSLWCEKHGGV